MSPVRADFLIAIAASAAMLVTRFWAALAGAEILGLVTLVRIVVGAAILGAVVAVLSQRTRSAVALVSGAVLATVAASVFTRGGFDPEAAIGASVMAAIVTLAAFLVTRRVVDWVAAQSRLLQAALTLVAVILAIALIALSSVAR